jgi:hypothetical protein
LVIQRLLILPLGFPFNELAKEDDCSWVLRKTEPCPIGDAEDLLQYQKFYQYVSCYLLEAVTLFAGISEHSGTPASLYASNTSSFGSISGSTTSFADKTVNLKIVEAFYKLIHGAETLPKDFAYSPSPSAGADAAIDPPLPTIDTAAGRDGMDIDLVPVATSSRATGSSEARTLSAAYASRLNKPNVDEYKNRPNYHYSYRFNTNLAEAIFHAESKAACPPARQQASRARGVTNTRGGRGQRGRGRGQGPSARNARNSNSGGEDTERDGEGEAEEEEEHGPVDATDKRESGGKNGASKVLLPWSLKSRTSLTDKYLYSSCWRSPKDVLVSTASPTDHPADYSQANSQQPHGVPTIPPRIPGKGL